MLEDLLKYLPLFISLFWALTLILSQEKAKHSRPILGIFMIISFFLYFSQVAVTYTKHSSAVYFDALYTFCILTIYPFLLFYVQSLTEGKSLKDLNYKLLIPAVTLSILSAFVYTLMNDAERHTYLYNYLLVYKKDPQFTLIVKSQILIYILVRTSFVSLVVYTFLKARKLILDYNVQLERTGENNEQKQLDWIYYLLLAFILASSFVIIFNIIGRLMAIQLSSPLMPLLFQLTFSTLIFSIGYLGFHQISDSHNSLEENTIDPCVTQDSKAQKSHSSCHLALLTRINKLFNNEKIFRQKDLKLKDIAERLNTNRTYISNIINSEYHCSFSEFVSQYRIREAKEVIRENPEKSFEEIAAMVGYGSLSTFFRSFKQSEGLTPSAYRKRCKMSMVNQ